VDDAGSGFASLRHVLELGPDIVKLDIEFIRKIDSDPARQALVAGMVHFAARGPFRLIAEGVETEAEREELLTLGVAYGQGYLFGRAEQVDRPPVEQAEVA
jgi:EAL domain-containing protein (putative c-di-GMP-specific phosphodiesterase class I)